MANEKIVVLNLKVLLNQETKDSLEKELSEKFGCKVILLPPTIDTQIQILEP